MSIERDLIRAIREDPLNDLLRAALSDRLEEIGTGYEIDPDNPGDGARNVSCVTPTALHHT